MAMMAKDCTNISAMIIAVKIFGALEGLRPRAFILAKLAAAKTALGPKTHIANINNKAKFLLISSARSHLTIR